MLTISPRATWAYTRSAARRLQQRYLHTGCRPGLSTLAIETSCDDTSVAILEIEKASSSPHSEANSLRTLVPFHERITANNDAYNGIHPLVALQSHQASLATLTQSALQQWSPDGSRRPTFVSVTRGPGMRSNLQVGLELAKGLSVAWGVPLLPVHHMQAHALTPRLCATLEDLPSLYQGPWRPESLKPTFPYLSVLASGGHTMLINSTGLTDHQILASTGDIAIGDCLDKAARAILPTEYIKTPYGKAITDFAFPKGEAEFQYAAPTNRRDELASRPTQWGWSLGVPLAESKGQGKTSRRMAFSFAGLLTSVERFMKHTYAQDGSIAEPRDPATASIEERRDLARETLRVCFEHLVSRILLHLFEPKTKNAADPIDTVVVSGGVASSSYLRHVIRAMLDARGFSHIKVLFPPPSLCTDNALMIAWAGIEMYTAGYTSSLDITPIRKWSMDHRAEAGGILGAHGWLKDGIPLPSKTVPTGID